MHGSEHGKGMLVSTCIKYRNSGSALWTLGVDSNGLGQNLCPSDSSCDSPGPGGTSATSNAYIKSYESMHCLVHPRGASLQTIVVKLFSLMLFDQSLVLLGLFIFAMALAHHYIEITARLTFL